jgi:hypothetical protein
MVDQLMSGLLAPFSSQNATAIIITVIVLGIFYLRFAIMRGVRWLVAKTSTITSTQKKLPPKQ